MTYKPIAFRGTEAQRRWKMCGSKRVYYTREEALANGSKVYPCPYCGYFHRSQLREKKI